MISISQLTLAMLPEQAGDVVVAMLDNELVELYMRLFFPDTSFDGSKDDNFDYLEFFKYPQSYSYRFVLTSQPWYPWARAVAW